MKKWILAVLAALLLVLFCSPTLAASNYISGNWEYKYLGNGTCEIVSYKGSEDTVTVPTTLDNMAVISIGASAFSNNGNIINVTIPEGITTLGNRAFYNCISLTYVSLPSTLTTLGDSAFFQSVYILLLSLFSFCQFF